MIKGNLNVSAGSVAWSLHTRRTGLKDDSNKKRMDKLAYTPAQFNSLETLGKNFIILLRQKEFFREGIFNNAAVRRIANAMNTNTAFTGSCTENPFWYQQSGLRKTRIQIQEVNNNRRL